MTPPSPDRQGTHGTLLLYLALTLLSLNGLFSKLIPLDAFTITQLRSLIAIGGFYCFCRYFRVPLKIGSWRRVVGVYLLGALMGIHWGTFFHAMQSSTVAVGILALFTYPMITILLEPFFNKTRCRMRDLVAGVMVLVGLLVMVRQDLQAGLSGSIFAGACWGVLSALLFSLRNLFQKYYFADLSSRTLMFHQLVAIAVMFVPILDPTPVALLNGRDWLLLVALALFGTAIAHTLYTASLKLLAAKTVALIGCLQPVFSILLAWAVLREVPSLSVVFGGAVILLIAAAETRSRSI